MHRDRLRGAAARGDGVEVVAALGDSVPGEVLQLAGEGLALAVTAGVAGEADLGEACSEALRTRAWPGDVELAAALDGARGNGPMPALRLLAVDLDELSELLESGPGEGGGLVDLDSGDVWSLSAIEYAHDSARRRPISMPRIGGSTCKPRAQLMATATWRCSSTQSRIQGALTGSGSRSPGKGRFGGSRTCSAGGLTRRNAGIASPRSGAGGVPANGWPTLAAAPLRDISGPAADFCVVTGRGLPTAAERSRSV
jgi:hypothetical protein